MMTESTPGPRPSTLDGPDMWVIYERPSDFPDKFVLRLWGIMNRLPAASTSYYLGDTLEEMRGLIHGLAPGAYNLGRQPGDDSVIVEVWIS